MKSENIGTKYVYVDETENADYFILTALSVDSAEDIHYAYRKFKKKVSAFKIKNFVKSKIFTEFKSTILDHGYERIRRQMMRTLTEIRCDVFFTVHQKNGTMFQKEKEDIYIQMLKRIIKNIEGSEYVYFDEFNKRDFEMKIIAEISGIPNVIQVNSCNSNREPGIQFADNLCNVIRKQYCEKKTDSSFPIIQNNVHEIK